MNPYQHVISILSKTLPDLMSPQEITGSPAHDVHLFSRKKSNRLHCIHAYGFGDSITKDKDTFHLNPAYVPCTSFDEVLVLYKSAVERVTLDGPTSYAPVINKAIEIVEEENKTFHILLIIADGQFVDEGPTVEAIIKASKYPLGIIVVGVGDGPWNLLYRFDDWLPQRRFDNFQFVEYNKVIRDFGSKHADTALALHALMEIPDQYSTVKKLGLLEEPPGETNSSPELNYHLIAEVTKLLEDNFPNDYKTPCLWVVMVFWRKLLKVTVTGGAGLFCINIVTGSIMSPVIFQGESMLPTISPNDIGLCDKRIPFSDIRRGDIVIVTSPKLPSILLCKRVIALEGDVVSDSKVKKEANSGYFDALKLKKSTCIPRGHVWLEGDNKSKSTDSRNYGPVPLGLVKSRVIGKVYPFRNAELFSREPSDSVEDEVEDDMSSSR